MEVGTYQPYLDQLIAWASSEPRKPDLLLAKGDYFKLTGEVFEDDKAFEARMASFLDWYLFDRPNPANSKTPAQEFFEAQQQHSSVEQANAFRSFTETLHGLFEVRKLGKGVVRMREVFSGKDHDVTERRQLAGLEKGDILEARLVPFGGHLVFSPAFCFHPRQVTKLIWKEVKRRKKKAPELPAKDLIWDCARRAIKAERYRQIAVEKIYDFENNPI